MNQQIGLICTDIDGTLLDSQNPDFAGLMEFKRALDDMRRQGGSQWAIVTGRHRRGVIPILEHFLAFHLVPDFVVLEDAYVFQFCRRRGLRSFYKWNWRIRWKRSWLWRRSRNLLQKWQKEMEDEFAEMKVLSHETIDMWMEFPDSQKAEHGETFLKHKVAESLDFEVYRWGSELFLAPAVGRKGEAVTFIADYLGMTPERVFAIGDGANDINMLEGWAAGMVACVGNAPVEIKRIVEHAGGYVAEQKATAGVLEALRSYSCVPYPAGKTE